MKLLHMSEREELLHKQETEIKEKSSHLHQELDHVNSVGGGHFSCFLVLHIRKNKKQLFKKNWKC